MAILGGCGSSAPVPLTCLIRWQIHFPRVACRAECILGTRAHHECIHVIVLMIAASRIDRTSSGGGGHGRRGGDC